MSDTFTEDFLTAMKAVTGLAAVVADRIKWGELQQGEERPCVNLWNTTRDPDYHMKGPSGLRQAFVTVDVWSMDYRSGNIARRLIEAPATAGGLSGFRDVVGGTDFQGIFCRSARDSSEPIAGQAAQRYFRASLDLEIWTGDAT